MNLKWIPFGILIAVGIFSLAALAFYSSGLIEITVGADSWMILIDGRPSPL